MISESNNTTVYLSKIHIDNFFYYDIEMWQKSRVVYHIKKVV